MQVAANSHAILRKATFGILHEAHKLPPPLDTDAMAWRAEIAASMCGASGYPNRSPSWGRPGRIATQTEKGDPKTTNKKPPRTRSQSVHYDLVVGKMFAKNSKQKLWLFVLYLFDPKFLEMAPGTHNVATN